MDMIWHDAIWNEMRWNWNSMLSDTWVWYVRIRYVWIYMIWYGMICVIWDTIWDEWDETEFCIIRHTIMIWDMRYDMICCNMRWNEMKQKFYVIRHMIMIC